MGTHQPPKAQTSRNYSICSYMSPYLFPTWKCILPFTTFHFLESCPYYVLLNASLRMVFSQNKNMIPQFNHQFCMKGLLCIDFIRSSLMQLKVWMSDIGPKQNQLNNITLSLLSPLLIVHRGYLSPPFFDPATPLLKNL